VPPDGERRRAVRLARAGPTKAFSPPVWQFGCVLTWCGAPAYFLLPTVRLAQYAFIRAAAALRWSMACAIVQIYKSLVQATSKKQSRRCP
jgi:hypothetical protein